MVTKSKPNMCQYPQQRPSSQPPLPRAQPLNTCSHITIQLQSHCRPYRILNIDAGVELAQQHASCVDMTIPASHHKSCVSILPTYNINISDHHTLPCSTSSQNYYYYYIDQRQHKRPKYTDLRNYRINRIMKIYTKIMKSSKLLKEYRTSSSTTCNGAITKKDTNYGYKIKTKYVPISATTTIFLTTTTTRTATINMLAHHHTVTISLSPLPYFEYRCWRGTRPAACELCRHDHPGKPE